MDNVTLFTRNLLSTYNFYLFLFQKSIPLSTLWTLAGPFELSMMTVRACKHASIIAICEALERLDSESNLEIKHISYNTGNYR